MSSDLPRRNRFSLFRAKRLFFRPLRPFVFRRPRPLFRPTFPPDARSASVCNLISAMRGIALPRIRVYLYIYRYRVLPPALLLFDHAAGIYIRLRVLFPAARVCCFSHAKMSHCRTRSTCVAPRRIMLDGIGLGPSRTRVFAAREKFLCARPTRKFIFRTLGYPHIAARLPRCRS